MDRNCTNCGRQLRPGAKFCSACGARVRRLPQVAQAALPSTPANALSPAVLLMADGRSHSLCAPVLVVDRAADCDIVLSDDTVSSRHAEITSDGVEYTVRDLGSRNGVWVNGRRVVSPCRLDPGDRVV